MSHPTVHDTPTTSIDGHLSTPGMGSERYFGDLHIFDLASQKWATKQTQLATQKAKSSGASPGLSEWQSSLHKKIQINDSAVKKIAGFQIISILRCVF